MKKLLLHSCCGPCSTSVIERLKKDYNITIFYYNPNIYPEAEYQKRLNTQKEYLKASHQDIKVIDGEYLDSSIFISEFIGLENCKEGGKRCEKCIYLRIKKTAEYAKNNGYDLFASTLSVSPHKNANLINSIGLKCENEYDVKYLISDFKKQDGYLNSIKLSKQYNLYRQNYCGCKYSIWDKEYLNKITK
ncbi:MAG: epoxyqueuosine reductase QueH [Clostridia bacterium]|nr:epoxyqueuosine reductase QueH [Clostridia bacterium]